MGGSPGLGTARLGHGPVLAEHRLAITTTGSSCHLHAILRGHEGSPRVISEASGRRRTPGVSCPNAARAGEVFTFGPELGLLGSEMTPVTD